MELGRISGFLLSLSILVFSFEISDTFFGINYWYFENLSERERKTVLEKLEEIPVDIVRIGGMWYDAKGIKKWVLEDFFDLCEKLGATPLVQIPMNSHSVDDLVSFIGKVRSIYHGNIIWSIGNEMDIYGDVDFEWVKPYSMEEAFELYGKFLEKLKELEKDAVVWGPNFSWKWRPWTIGDWTTPFLRRFEVDVFAVHRYPFRYVFSWEEIVRDVQNFYAEMRKLKKVLKIRVALTETNLSWDWEFCSEYSPEGELAGLWLASIILRSMVLGLQNVSVWSTVNDSCLSILVVDGDKAIERGTFKALKMFKGLPKNITTYSLSKWIDFVEFGKEMLVVNRYDRALDLKLEGGILKVPPMGVYRYVFDEVWKLSKSWEVER